MSENFYTKKPVITYPCIWSYTIIGRNAEEMRQAVNDILGDRAFAIAPSNRSASGKYVSLVLDVEVPCESSRTTLFTALKNHQVITMVL